VAKLQLVQDPAADALLEANPFALVVGMLLDQQYPMEAAFAGPKKIADRIGGVDPFEIADYDPEEFAALCSKTPAIHRFPGSMAGKVQALCVAIVERYDGDASRIWREAKDGRDLQARLLDLPGFGEMKARTVLSVLAKRYGVSLPGLSDVVPKHPTLGDVDSAEALAEYQAHKRARKQQARALKQRT